VESATGLNAPTLDPWTGTIDGLPVGGEGSTAYGLRSVDGLEELTEIRTSDEPYPTADGEFVGDDFLAGRTITLSLDLADTWGVPFREALAALRWACRPKRTIPFWFRLPAWDTPRGCQVRVRRLRIPTDLQYELGHTRVDIQLRSSLATLYGPTDTTPSTPFAAPAGGLRYPLYTDGDGVAHGHLDYGAASATGRLVLNNPGNAPTWPVFEVDGPVPSEGFQIVRTDTGDRIQFEAPVASGSTLRIDAAEGSALIDGHADRGGALTWRDWWPVDPRESPELAFVRLGAPSAAVLRVFAPPGWW
jgi:hypothetical protein